VVVGAGRALLEARGGRSGSLALLYSSAVLVSAAIYYPSLGYEPYDARLRRLAWSPVVVLTSVDGRRAFTPGPLRLPRLNPSRRVLCTNLVIGEPGRPDSDPSWGERGVGSLPRVVTDRTRNRQGPTSGSI
jgi:hypothetical protein